MAEEEKSLRCKISTDTVYNITVRGSLKQIVIEKVSVLVKIDFSWPTSKSYMDDNARKRMKYK